MTDCVTGRDVDLEPLRKAIRSSGLDPKTIATRSDVRVSQVINIAQGATRASALTADEIVRLAFGFEVPLEAVFPEVM